MNGSALIDSSFLRKLELLAVRWQKSFPGLVGGHNASRFAGPGQEFLDHRHFHHGDDLRAINWRAYLRLEKLFLKMFQVEPRVPVRLLLDCSRSMETGDPTKFDYARRLAAALCYIGLVRLDTICLQPFADNLAQPFLSSGGRHQFVSTAEFLSSLAIREHTDFLRAARDFIARYPQRGLLIVISDFLDDVGCEKPLQFFADYGHELMLIHLWAEEDRTPPWDGQLELIDSETGDTFNLAFGDRARDEYTAGFDRFAEAVKSVANRSGGRYVGLSTAIPIEEAVFGPIVQFGGIE